MIPKQRIQRIVLASWFTGPYLPHWRQYNPRGGRKMTLQPLTISLHQTDQPATLFQRYMTKKQTQLALRLDMKDLADGDYEMVVQSGCGRLVKQLSVGLSRNFTEDF
jgi:hypothetical protein